MRFAFTRAIRAVAGSYVPLYLADAYVYLHADDVVTSGANVVSWTSRVGDCVFTPHNGTPTVVTDGSLGDIVDFTAGGLRDASTAMDGSSQTIYVVATNSPFAGGTNDYVISNSGYFLTLVTTGTGWGYVDSPSLTTYTLTGAEAGPAVIAVSFDADANTATAYVNGVAGSSNVWNIANSVAPSDIALGTFSGTPGFGWAGRLASVLISETAHDAALVESNSAALAREWGIA